MNKHTTQRRNIHLYQVKDEAQNTSEDQWGGGIKDIYAQNKPNDEYETAPGQFC